MVHPEPMKFMGPPSSCRWLVTQQVDLATLLESCPQSLAGKYVAVTSQDSGPMVLTDEEKRLGWHSRNEIAYSPKIALSKVVGLGGVTTGNCTGTNNGRVL